MGVKGRTDSFRFLIRRFFFRFCSALIRLASF